MLAHTSLYGIFKIINTLTKALLLFSHDNVQLNDSYSQYTSTHTHTCTYTCACAQTHAHTHARTHALFAILPGQHSSCSALKQQAYQSHISAKRDETHPPNTIHNLQTQNTPSLLTSLALTVLGDISSSAGCSATSSATSSWPRPRRTDQDSNTSPAK